MSKYSRDKKVLIRNPGVPVRSCRNIGNLQKSKKVHFAEEHLSSENGCMSDLTSPEFCTLLQITDEIKRIRNTNGSTSTTFIGPRYRNLNFLPEEKIFQNLIGLDLPEEKFVTGTRSQPVNLNVKKDPEPDLNEFLKCSFQPEYLFPSYNTPVKKKEQKTKCDGHSIYYKIKIWEEERFYHM